MGQLEVIMNHSNYCMNKKDNEVKRSEALNDFSYKMSIHTIIVLLNTQIYNVRMYILPFNYQRMDINVIFHNVTFVNMYS